MRCLWRDSGMTPHHVGCLRLLLLLRLITSFTRTPMPYADVDADAAFLSIRYADAAAAAQLPLMIRFLLSDATPLRCRHCRFALIFQ